MSRKTTYPKVMCTQHPDSASRYISTQEEPGEAIEAAVVFGCDEYMPDYEGKATPYHQNVQVVSKFIEETGLVPGKDVFITPRAPSAVQENRFRQLMVMMSIAEANHSALEYSDVQAINEFVHPMTGTVREIIDAQQHMVDVSELAKKEFGFEMEVPRIIPLIEDAPALLNAKELAKSTLFAWKERFGTAPEKFRVFLGKSDSALSFGHVASTLSCKYAINGISELESELDTEMGIIFGAGTLPFRGHLDLKNAENFFREYRGIGTITLQSAVRYSHEKGDAEALVNLAKKKLPETPELFSLEEKEELVNLIGIFGTRYSRIIRELSSTINQLADLLPQQRDRLMHSGSGGYSRSAPDISGIIRLCRSDIGKELNASMPAENLHLPRAIKFTGALYSIGLPPEFIGTGTALKEAREKLGDEACERLLTKYFPSLASDLSFASGYLDLNVASRFLSGACLKEVQRDIEVLNDTFNLETRPEPSYRILLEMMQPDLLQAGTAGNCMDEEVSQLVCSTLTKMGKIRKALG
ncbi:phosphoenolpyruvate carboxylase [Methanosarcina sp. 2.H.A.1B.4]|uniref:phosphoenolpyruvate carboxylase n=1 Tax=Methanosarcina sp. 2.H.A.1B.4 TaxID=1483600 RepID=UPI000622A2C1|nr:phosphoenolpyruvate carboxylase [Methanosarcina sp. 2.H.A.1B.4]KKG08788.1 phosphoenolpyruvate carboxylase [Methanosarcina sp. 2.H.A.1B.4]